MYFENEYGYVIHHKVGENCSDVIIRILSKKTAYSEAEALKWLKCVALFPSLTGTRIQWSVRDRRLEAQYRLRSDAWCLNIAQGPLDTVPSRRPQHIPTTYSPTDQVNSQSH